jgi:predicted signal transduction protein with EAL and GGDEF domain
MGEDQLGPYRALSRAPYPKSYVGKVFLTPFLGTHVPLLALLVYFVRCRFALEDARCVLSATVPATLAGRTAFTLWAMYALSGPTELASRALRRYLESGELPELPVYYTDRAGRLMADVQHTVERLDAAVRSLEGQAMRDHLTGAFNRRAAEERLAEDIKRAERGGGALSLALLDLDRLKSVNGEYSHRAGDAYLARFAEALGRNVRPGDWVAR